MDRRVVAAALVFALAACGGGGGGGGGATQAAGGVGGGGGAGLRAKANAVKDWCALIPMSVITTWAPSAAPVTKDVAYPDECGTNNGVQALDFRYSTGFGHFEVPQGSTTVDGVGLPAYNESNVVDEPELLVVIDDNDNDNAYLFIDVAGHDGKDHVADAVGIAKAVIAQLQ